MNYKLNNIKTSKSFRQTVASLWPFFKDDSKSLVISLIALLLNSLASLATPIVIGMAIDNYIQQGDYQGVLRSGLILFGLYLISLVTSYYQTKIMGTISQQLLFKLRSAIFAKLQTLPVAFFDLNKAGDLISRINNDTDHLNQFFSQALMRFIGNLFMMLGATIFIIFIHPQLGLVTLIPAVLLLIFTKLVSQWVKSKNALSLKAVGNMSAEIQESLDNFKVIAIFNRRDYFNQKFDIVNQNNFQLAIKAGYANNIFTPVYDLAGNLAQMLVLFYGIYLISIGNFSVGLLISYISYVSWLYDPIRQMAMLWSSFQVALASWDRIAIILSLKSNLPVLTEKLQTKTTIKQANILEFHKVCFHYSTNKEVLHDINLQLETGKTYALVGPTGGGKTTTASLMARLYDPSAGQILLAGNDLRSYTDSERCQKIGFILQEPFLFSGTIKENILYGNPEYAQYSDQELSRILQEKYHFKDLLKHFHHGLATQIDGNNESISLGQKQLIAFMRIVLRHPDLLILDEATANVDTVTEKLLDEIIRTLPSSTTKVIIAHRLNTIKNADQIFFVNSGKITLAGSFDHAIDMLLKQKRRS